MGHPAYLRGAGNKKRANRGLHFKIISIFGTINTDVDPSLTHIQLAMALVVQRVSCFVCGNEN